MNSFSRSDDASRRQFMSQAARTLLGVHLLPLFGSSLASGATPAAAGKAKHVIYLFMAGGMSHLDTFDPKPKRKQVMGSTETIASKADDIHLGHYLKHTAEVMDRCCVIRSMNSTQGAHEQGSYIMHTSYGMRGTVQHPSLGSWVMKLGGRLHPELPGFVAIDTSPEHIGGGFFGANYAAAPIGNPAEGLQDCRRAPQVDEVDFTRRLELADKMNRKFHQRFPNADVGSYEDLYREATRLMKSEDLAAFDLTKESQATRDLYGPGRFAQGCLLARRLIEHDVRFVEVQLGGWDTHYDNFTGVEGRCQEFDQAFAALIKDLEACGKLADTLVVVATEFGRTPEINEAHNAGRDHHPSAFSCVLAGGGIKGGTAYGSTDPKGNKVRDDLVSVQDFNATIAYALGLPHELVMMSPSRRPFKIADQGKPVTRIFG